MSAAAFGRRAVGIRGGVGGRGFGHRRVGVGAQGEEGVVGVVEELALLDGRRPVAGGGSALPAASSSSPAAASSSDIGTAASPIS